MVKHLEFLHGEHIQNLFFQYLKYKPIIIFFHNLRKGNFCKNNKANYFIIITNNKKFYKPCTNAYEKQGFILGIWQ
jgi:hypothetical protein